MNILFVIDEYGPAIVSNEDYGLLITLNGSYFNLWLKKGDDDWENTEAFAVEGRVDLAKDRFWDIVKVGEELLEEIIEPDEEDEEDEEDEDEEDEDD